MYVGRQAVGICALCTVATLCIAKVKEVWLKVKSIANSRPRSEIESPSAVLWKVKRQAEAACGHDPSVRRTAKLYQARPTGASHSKESTVCTPDEDAC